MWKAKFHKARNSMLDKYRILLLALSMILSFLFWELIFPDEDEEDGPTLKLLT